MATLIRHFPLESPGSGRLVFTYTGAAVSNLQFQQFRNGELQNEVDDYNIAIGLGTTVVTFLAAPDATDQVVAYF